MRAPDATKHGDVLYFDGPGRYWAIESGGYYSVHRCPDEIQGDVDVETIDQWRRSFIAGPTFILNSMDEWEQLRR